MEKMLGGEVEGRRRGRVTKGATMRGARRGLAAEESEMQKRWSETGTRVPFEHAA